MQLGIGHFGVGVFTAAVALAITGVHRRIDHDGYARIVSELFAIVPDLGQVLPHTDQSALANLSGSTPHLTGTRFSTALRGRPF